MIPKIIHYCWFGRKPKPKNVLKYIQTWKDKMPDYEIKEWNEDNFNIKKNKYVYEAYMVKKFAFVSDYARFFALYEEGGIYLDTDVEVKKSFDDLLDNKSFVGWEDNFVGTGVIASEKKQKWLKDVLDTYNGEDFILWSGKLNTIPNPYRMNEVLKTYGLRMNHEKDLLKGNIAIYPIEILCAHNNEKAEYCITDKTICIHHYYGTWKSENGDSIWNKLCKRIVNLKIKINCIKTYSAKKIYYLSGPHINVEKGYWLYDQLKKDGYTIKSYYLYKYGHSRDFSTKIHKYTSPIKLIMQSRKNDYVLLYDVTSEFIILGFIVHLFKLKRHIVAVNFMGSGKNEGYEKWKRPIIHTALQTMRIGVNNVELRDLYCNQLNLSSKNFFIIKDCAANVDLRYRDCTPSAEQYIFMGGNVHRDWTLFKKVVKDCSDCNFIAALGGNELDDFQAENLKVYKNIPLDDFNTLIAKCKIVFLPLDTEIQGGQLVAFQASIYKKPIIMTKCISINAYYGDKDIIKIAIGDIKGCENAIRDLMSNNILYKEISERGYNQIKVLTPDIIYEEIRKQF